MVVQCPKHATTTTSCFGPSLKVVLLLSCQLCPVVLHTGELWQRPEKWRRTPYPATSRASRSTTNLFPPTTKPWLLPWTWSTRPNNYCSGFNIACLNSPPLHLAKSSGFWSRMVLFLTMRPEATSSFIIRCRKGVRWWRVTIATFPRGLSSHYRGKQASRGTS